MLQSISILRIPFRLCLLLLANFILIANISTQNWSLLGEAFYESNEDCIFQFIDMSPDGSTIAIAQTCYDFNTPGDLLADYVRVYKYNQNTNNWEQKGEIINTDFRMENGFMSIDFSLDGNNILIGAPDHFETINQRGIVKSFSWNGNKWLQKGQSLYGEGREGYTPQFGWIVKSSNDGNTIAISAIEEQVSEESQGAIFTYQWNGNKWEQIGEKITSFYESVSQFGSSLSLSGNGNVVAVCSSNDYTFQVFERSGQDWIDKGQLFNFFNDNNDFGFDPNIILNDNGNTIALGSGNNLVVSTGEFIGYVKVFDWTGSTWSQRGNTFVGPVPDDSFGSTIGLSLTGDKIAIGAPAYEDGIGYIKTYQWNNISKNWFQYGSTIIGNDELDHLGVYSPISSISLSQFGNRLAFAPQYNPDEDIPITKIYELNNLSTTSEISAMEIKVFPNPAIDFGTVSFSEFKNFNLTILNPSGKLVFSKNYENRKQVEFNLSHEQGLYMIQVKDLKTGEIAFSPVIKIR